MLKKNLFIIFGFKIVWLSCIFGEIYFGSILGLFVGLFFLIFFFTIHNNRLENLKIITLFSFIGYLFDSLLSFFELYKISAEINFLFLPIWFLILWPSFSCLLIYVLKFLKNKILLSAFAGSLFGPISYYAGVSSGLATYTSFLTFFLLSLFWSLLMIFYSKIK